MFYGNSVPEQICTEPDYEKQLSKLLQEQKDIRQFIDGVIAVSGNYYLMGENRNIAEAFGIACMRQMKLPYEIVALQKKIDKE